MRTAALLALVVTTLACGAEPPASCGAPGRVMACACPGVQGMQGAQECSPGGAWSVCVCPDGGAMEAGVDAGGDAQLADAGPDTLDVSPAADADGGSDAPEVPEDNGGCPFGMADCDRNPANGCEVDLRTAFAHCGRCERSCTGARKTCTDGVCLIRPGM